MLARVKRQFTGKSIEFIIKVPKKNAQTDSLLN
jgi:hypothetical protein